MVPIGAGNSPPQCSKKAMHDEKERTMFMELNATALEQFSRLSREAGARADYVQGGGGNTSVKLDGGLMAIKASGFRLADIRPDKAYAVLDYMALRKFYLGHEVTQLQNVEQAGAAEAKAATKEIEGLSALRPSVEAGFHSLLDTFVLHTHSVYGNLAACAEEGQALCAEAFAGAPYSWGFVPYVDPGARLTFTVRDALARVEKQAGKRPAVIVMQNHGLIVHHDDADTCARIHADANLRIAKVFGISAASFPPVSLRQEGVYFCSDTPFLSEQLKSGAYSEEFLLRQPLYPDQLVFLNGTLFFGGDPAPDCCALDPAAGEVRYNMPEAKALVVEETLTAVTFIVSTIRKAGYTVAVMGEEAREFIANWESEQYRKSLAGKA